MTPPPRPWLLAYRLLGLRLPAEYRPWVAADVRTRSFLWWRELRTFLWLLVGIGLYAAGQHAKYQWPSSKWCVYALGFAVAYSVLASRKSLVRRTLAWQRVEPATPKRLDRLDNEHAALGSVLLLVLLTAGAAVVGYGLRPTSLAGAPCSTPDPAVVDRIRGAIDHPGAKLVAAQEIRYGDREMVGAFLNDPSEKDPKKRTQAAVVLLTNGEPSLIPFQGVDSWLDLPRAPQVDRGVSSALVPLFNCFKKAAPR